MSFKSIGMELGARDHSTIIYYCDDVEKLMNILEIYQFQKDNYLLQY